MNVVNSAGNASFAGAMADEFTIIPVASIHRMMFEYQAMLRGRMLGETIDDLNNEVTYVFIRAVLTDLAIVENLQCHQKILVLPLVGDTTSQTVFGYAI
ncbi:hypothetical protein O166_03315 [Pseudogulbenkiania ferrooxidans EGD-HP2]|uniref:Uncharacterized protein n=1 Tax=Pseudogulbenkiania ferrooxidans EGD-HP2 TaxID=1388764 RepID=A0ABN0NAK7_9NEIS|nr:hypothetical protein O166_03315 [Pseudogulbenkiania ferrooxidans EGD-HP2]